MTNEESAKSYGIAGIFSQPKLQSSVEFGGYFLRYKPLGDGEHKNRVAVEVGPFESFIKGLITDSYWGSGIIEGKMNDGLNLNFNKRHYTAVRNKEVMEDNSLPDSRFEFSFKGLGGTFAGKYVLWDNGKISWTDKASCRVFSLERLSDVDLVDALANIRLPTESETKEKLKSLNDALAGNYDSLLRLTKTNDIIEGTISLLGYKKGLDIKPIGPGDYAQPEDYTEGAVVRAAAAELLGRIGDKRAVQPLKYALHDSGDGDGANDSRSSFYYSDKGLVKQTAKVALDELKSRHHI